MEEARRVLARLRRIEDLERDAAHAADVLAELDGLVDDVEAWLQADAAADGRAAAALERCRQALLGRRVPTATG